MRKLTDLVKDLRPCYKICPIIILFFLILFIVGVAVPSLFLILLALFAIFVNVAVMAVSYFLHENTFVRKGSAKIDKIIRAIEGKNFISVSDLSRELKLSESNIRSVIFDGIRDGSLCGYTLRGDDLIVQPAESFGGISEDSGFEKCSCCGASYDGKLKKCPYCENPCK